MSDSDKQRPKFPVSNKNISNEQMPAKNTHWVKYPSYNKAEDFLAPTNFRKYVEEYHPPTLYSKWGDL